MSVIQRALACAVLLLSFAAVRSTAAEYAESFAQLTLLPGTLAQQPGTPCPFLALTTMASSPAACGEAFTVHWGNDTTNDDGFRTVGLLQNGNAYSASYCAEGAGTASGSGEVWFTVGSEETGAPNVRLTVDAESGAVLLAGFAPSASDGGLAVCSAFYLVSEDDGLDSLLFDSLDGSL